MDGSAMQFDLLIINGTVYDGTGVAGVRADVGIDGKRISAIGDLAAASATRVIDANGHAVTPGFIDAHSHADAALLRDGQHACGIRQGVTTEIIAPDGLTLAPLSHDNYLMYMHYLSGILGYAPEGLDMSTYATAMSNYHNKTSCNVAMFLGHGPVRLEAIGGMRDEPLVGDGWDRAERIIRESFEQGACGFATGLSYYPNSYSDTDELVNIMNVVKEYERPLSIHLRNHNTDRGFAGGGVEEAMEVGRRTGAQIHLEHYRTQPDSAGELDALMEPVERAKADGVDVTLETYPYPVGSSFPQSFFPGWFHEGGPEAMLKLLADGESREEVIAGIRSGTRGGLSGNVWSSIGSAANKDIEGMSFNDVAEQWGVSLEEMMCRVMLEEDLNCGFRGAPPASTRVWQQVEADIMDLMQRPDYMVGSDAIPTGGMVHPRAYGCFPRMIGRLRRRHNIPLELMVQRLSQNAALRFGLKDRGEIAVGKFADIVIFDSERITDRATFEDPEQFPEGIPFVVVNGRVAVDHERVTGVLAGEAV